MVSSINEKNNKKSTGNFNSKSYESGNIWYIEIYAKKIISKKYRERLIDSMMVKLKMKEETRKMKIQRIMRNKKQQIKKELGKRL